MIKLRPYQQECIDAIFADFHKGIKRTSAVIATGGGKTIIFASLAARWRAEHGGRVLILAHREELVRQAADKYLSVNPGANVGIVKAEENEVDADVVVASVQTLYSENRRNQIKDVKLVICDECHHFASDKFLEVINHFDVATVGVTATMIRSDGRALGDVWQNIAYEKSILWMIRNRYLCDVRGIQVTIPGLDLSGVRRSGKDFNEVDLGDSLMESMAPSVVAKAYREHAAEMPGVVFTPTVETALAVAEAFRAEGFATQAVWGDMPKHDRSRIIAEYDRGKLQVLTSVMALTEGWDAPRAQCAVIMRPTKSPGLYTQQIGRVLRLAPNKPYALVLDVVGVSSELELATLNVLAGERKLDQLKSGESLLDALDKDDARLAKESAEIGYVGTTNHAEVDLFGGSRQQWLQTYGNNWFLPAGERFIAILPIKDSSSVDVAYFYNEGSRGGGYIARNVPSLEYAMAHGEGDITDEEEIIARKAGKWRKRKATIKQLSYAKRIKLTLPDDSLNALRAGVVSDAIAIHTASARMDKKVAALLG